jgi:F420-dependent oxidoreductase-like protein
MRIALMIEPQMGLSYADQLAVARRAEAAGLETLFRSDHYDSFPGDADAPTTDAWAVLAGLARETERIGLGVLVSPATFRHPANVVKMATTVQEMSGGRLELGLGTGWHEGEHRHHGFAFPPIAERADLLEEQLAVVTGLLREPDGWSFSGAHYEVQGAAIRPRPDPVPPIIVGGEGSPRSMRIAVRWADEFNLSSSSPQIAREKMTRLDATCADAGRAPASLRRSAMVGVLIGRDRAAVDARLARLIADVGAADGADAWLDARRPRWVLGTPDEARATISRFADAGVERMVLQDFLPRDLAMIDEIGEEIVGRT